MALCDPLARAISECFRDEVHDEALYKSTFFTLLLFIEFSNDDNNIDVYDRQRRFYFVAHLKLFVALVKF